MTFGEKIQALRKQAGMSQEELAYQLKVSRQAISKWERDSGYPETEKIVAMSKLFDVTLDYLLNDDNENAEESPFDEPGTYVSLEKAEGFLGSQALKYRKISLGVALLLAATAFIFFDPLIGAVLYLVVIIVAVALFISAAMQGSDYKGIWAEPLLFDQDTKKKLRIEYVAKKRKCRNAIIAAVAVMLVGMLVVPTIALLLDDSETAVNLSIAAGMILCGIGAYLCIYNIGILRSYRPLTS